MTDVKTTNLDKALFPDGTTKGDLIEYYSKISPKMLPHLQGRPFTMERYPNGINGQKFFQKNIQPYFPSYIDRIKIVHEKKTTTYAVCNNNETIVYLANLACIPFHTWLSRVDNLRYPDKLIFDLDPQNDNRKSITELADAFLFILEKCGLTVFVMTTGSRGAHIVIPLDGRARFDEARAFASKIAGFVAERAPKKATVEQRKDKRKGDVFIDTYRNSFAQTAVAPYSVRAVDGAPVAAPLFWDEVKNFNPQKYNINNIFKRTEDPWQDFWKTKCNIERASVKWQRLVK